MSVIPFLHEDRKQVLQSIDDRLTFYHVCFRKNFDTPVCVLAAICWLIAFGVASIVRIASSVGIRNIWAFHGMTVHSICLVAR